MVDRRAERRAAKRQQILEAAWDLARERGLLGWTLRDLSAAVGMRAPSLFVYFENKDQIYDEMFAQGNRELLAIVDEIAARDLDPIDKLRVGARAFFDFAVADQARLHLLFLRVVPGFVPSRDSYALAEQVLARLGDHLAFAGFTEPAVVDLWTAVLTGLATQQVSNDPGGRRWADLVDPAFDALVAGQQSG